MVLPAKSIRDNDLALSVASSTSSEASSGGSSKCPALVKTGSAEGFLTADVSCDLASEGALFSKLKDIDAERSAAMTRAKRWIKWGLTGRLGERRCRRKATNKARMGIWSRVEPPTSVPQKAGKRCRAVARRKMALIWNPYVQPGFESRRRRHGHSDNSNIRHDQKWTDL